VRWCEAGVWERLLAALAADPDTEHGMMDATIVRAHPCAAGAHKNTARKRSGAVGVASVARATSRLTG
jgi:transposase